MKRICSIIRRLGAVLILFTVSSALAYEFSPVDLHPILLVISIFAVSAALWWVAGKLRHAVTKDGQFRFTVKTLLVGVLLVCILLATAGRRLHDLSRQSIALYQIRSTDGQISGHNSTPKLNLGLQNWIGFDPWERYTSIDADNDAALIGVCRHPNAFRHLAHLSIGDRVSDVGMAHLSANLFLRLNQIGLYGNSITSSGLRRVAAIQRVDSVWINGCYAISDDSFQGFEHLRYLGILGDSEGKKRLQLTDASMSHIGKMTKLESLWLTGAPGITDVGLLRLVECKSLTDVLLRNTSITDVGVKQLREQLPNCRIRNLGDAPNGGPLPNI